MIAPPSKVTTYQTPGGYATTTWTIKFMCDVVAAEHTDPMLRRRYRELTYGLPSMDYEGEIRAVWDFVVGNIRYQRDPLGAEHITSPKEIDRQIREEGAAAEDCESIALYAATLFAAGGLRSEFEIQGRNPAFPERFSHCALRVLNPTSKQWTSFDPVGAFAYPGFGLGDTLAVPGDPVQHFALTGERTMDGLLGELFGDSATDLQNVKLVGDPIAKAAMGFGPYGAIIGGLFEAGTGIAQAVVGEPRAPQKPQPSPPTAPHPTFFPAPNVVKAPPEDKKHTHVSSSTVPTWAWVVGALVGARLLRVI